jgi:hypothetical protein
LPVAAAGPVGPVAAASATSEGSPASARSCAVGLRCGSGGAVAASLSRVTLDRTALSVSGFCPAPGGKSLLISAAKSTA